MIEEARIRWLRKTEEQLPAEKADQAGPALRVAAWILARQELSLRRFGLEAAHAEACTRVLMKSLIPLVQDERAAGRMVAVMTGSFGDAEASATKNG